MAREKQEEMDNQSITLGSMYFKESNPNGKDLEQFESGVFDQNHSAAIKYVNERTRTSSHVGQLYKPKISSSFFLTK